MYRRNYTGTISHVLCREVYYTVSLFGRVHYQRFLCVFITCQDCLVQLVQGSGRGRGVCSTREGRGGGGGLGVCSAREGRGRGTGGVQCKGGEGEGDWGCAVQGGEGGGGCVVQWVES